MEQTLDSIINTGLYPLETGDSQSFKTLCLDARQTFARCGALELPDFLQPVVVEQLIENASASKRDGHRMNGMFPAYSDAMNDPDDISLPLDHPTRLRLPASHCFLPGDLIGADSPLRTLYESEHFISFIKSILGCPVIYPVADPMGNINMLVYEPGDQNGWHFDTTDFIVSLILKPADSGGDYQYIPDLRSPVDENLAAVSARMQDPDDQSGIEYVELKKGSLFLFRGKYTLHRVTRITGASDRIVAILSYHPDAGRMISDSSKLAMYGRVKPLDL